MKKKKCYIRSCDLIDADVFFTWAAYSGNSDKCFTWKSEKGILKKRNTEFCLKCVYNSEYHFCYLTTKEERQVKLSQLKRESIFGKINHKTK